MPSSSVPRSPPASRQRLAPFRPTGHHPSGTGRITELQQGRAEALHHRQGLFLRQIVGQDQGIVLVGLQQLLAASFAAHHQQAAAPAQGWRQQQFEKPFEQLLVERADQLHDEAQADTVAGQGSDQGVQGFRAAAQVAEVVGAGDAQRQDVGMGGEQAEHLGQVQQADHLAVLGDRDPLDTLARHEDHRVEQEIAQFDAGQRTMGQRPDRLQARCAVAEVRAHEVGAGDDAEFGPVPLQPHQQGIGAVAQLQARGVAEGQRGLHLQRRQQVLAGDAGKDELGQVLPVALGQLALGRQVGLEEAGEPRVLPAQLVEATGRQLVDDAFLDRQVAVLAAAGEQPADVEQVVRGVLGEYPPVVAALLDHALEQDEQPGDRRTGLQQGFPGA